jgi:phage-related protein
MIQLQLSHYYPIEITTKAEAMTAGFSEGYKQQSSFEPLKSTRLNYLVSAQDTTNLISTLDSASGVDTFNWLFRPHYTLKQWRVASFTEKIYDSNRRSELSLDLTEIRVGLPTPTPTTVTPLRLVSGAELTPNSEPIITRSYLIRSPNLGYFPDRRAEPLNPKVDKIELTSTIDLDNADSIDLLLERCRGVYPLLWQGSTYTCKDWRITYNPESAEISLSLETVIL